MIDFLQTDGLWERRGGYYISVDFYGRYHNSLGPAIIYDDGTKQWHVNGKLHRLDGPAFECADGRKEWWVDDVRVSKQGFHAAVISFLLQCDKETAILVKEQFE